METISLKLEDNLLTEIDSNLGKYRYSTRTEFIRDAIRTKLKELEKEEAIKKLTELKGSLKGQRKVGYEEARQKAAENIAKKLGVKLD